MMFKKNPSCSQVMVSMGKDIFVYFYYSNGGSRKQIKYKKGLNEGGISVKERKKRIQAIQYQVQHDLENKVFNGVEFEVEVVVVIPTYTIASETYLDNRRKFLTDKTITNYQLGIDFFQGYLKHIEKPRLLISAITPELIEDYIIHLKAFVSPRFNKGLSNYTIKEYKTRLGAVLIFWYSKRRVLKSNPMDGVRLGFAIQHNTPDVNTVYTVEELQSIINYCKQYRKPPYLTFLLLIYYTHLRPIEICRLQMEDIDMGKRVINLPAPKSKTRIARVVPLDAPIYRHLISTQIDFTAQESGKKYMVTIGGNKRISYVGDEMYKHKAMSYSFKTMLRDLGIDGRMTKYHLKHTANAHEVVFEEMTFAEIQSKNGHTLSKTTEVYLRDLKEYYKNPSMKERKLVFDI
jgi:integrase